MTFLNTLQLVTAQIILSITGVGLGHSVLFVFGFLVFYELDAVFFP